MLEGVIRGQRRCATVWVGLHNPATPVRSDAGGLSLVDTKEVYVAHVECLLTDAIMF